MSLFNGSSLARLRALSARLSLLESDSCLHRTGFNLLLAGKESKDLERRDRLRSLQLRIDRIELEELFGDSNDLQELYSFESRLELLERGVVKLHASAVKSQNTARVARALLNNGLSDQDFHFLKVPDAQNYYERMSLDDRGRMLGSPSPDFLCKTLLFSLVGLRTEEESPATVLSPTDFAILVVPYSSKIDATKLKIALRKAGILTTSQTPCLAPKSLAAAILGFSFNGVAFVGGCSEMSTNIPIIFADVISHFDPPIMYSGGGEPDTKLVIKDVAKLFRSLPTASVLDITEKRATTQSNLDFLDENDSVAVFTANKQEYSIKPRSKSPSQGSADAANDSENPPGNLNDRSSIDFNHLDVRVGIIKNARLHPASDKLMCEEIDIGEETGPRNIVSGIQKHYKPDELVNLRVCLVANLKPATLGGEKSYGMILCASWMRDGHEYVRLVCPPLDAPIGSRIMSPLSIESPANANHVKKRKIFERVAEHLKLDKSGAVCFMDIPLITDGSITQHCLVLEGEPGAPVS